MVERTLVSEDRVLPRVTRECGGAIFPTVEIAGQFMARDSTSIGLKVTVRRQGCETRVTEPDNPRDCGESGRERDQPGSREAVY